MQLVEDLILRGVERYSALASYHVNDSIFSMTRQGFTFIGIFNEKYLDYINSTQTEWMINNTLKSNEYVIFNFIKPLRLLGLQLSYINIHPFRGVEMRVSNTNSVLTYKVKEDEMLLDNYKDMVVNSYRNLKKFSELDDLPLCNLYTYIIDGLILNKRTRNYYRVSDLDKAKSLINRYSSCEGFSDFKYSEFFDFLNLINTIIKQPTNISNPFKLTINHIEFRIATFKKYGNSVVIKLPGLSGLSLVYAQYDQNGIEYHRLERFYTLIGESNVNTLINKLEFYKLKTL